MIDFQNPNLKKRPNFENNKNFSHSDRKNLKQQNSDRDPNSRPIMRNSVRDHFQDFFHFQDFHFFTVSRQFHSHYTQLQRTGTKKRNFGRESKVKRTHVVFNMRIRHPT